MIMPTRASFICWQPSARCFAHAVTASEARAGGVSIYFDADTESGPTLAQAIYLSSFFYPPPLCSGLGACGQCRVRVLENPPAPLPGDIRFFSAAELGMGWRLGCLHRPAQGMLVVLPPQETINAVASGLDAGISSAANHPACLPFLAIDLGTTSLQWLATDGKKQIAGSRVNPQMGAGGDVVSRLVYAGTAEGMACLHGLTHKAFLDIVREVRSAGLEPHSIVLAANAAMTAIALGLGPEAAQNLGKSPYSLPAQLMPKPGSPCFFEGLPPLLAVPALAPFVGGDIAAGYVALVLGEKPPRYPFLLADMGTNGEFLLALAPDKAIMGSVALGPALEGASLTFGSEARPSVVTSFVLNSKGLEAVCLEGRAGESVTLQPGDRLKGEHPRISGTGYLSLVHRLLLAKGMRQDGSFCPQAPLLARQREALQVVAGRSGLPIPEEPHWPLPHNMFLTAGDVEEILKVKAAFSLGLACLLQKAGLCWRDLSAVYLAGALGRNADPAALEALGFIPQGGAALVQVAGNTSLAGAVLLGQDSRLWQSLDSWARGSVTCLHLAEDAKFSQNYVANMVFSYRGLQADDDSPKLAGSSL